MLANLTIQHLSKSYGFQPVLNDVSLVVNAGERVGLVGANGVGKSTLLKIVTGEIPADGGTVTLAPDRKLGYLAQTISGFDEQTLSDLIARAVAQLRDLEARMRDLEAQMSAGDDLAVILHEYGEAADQFERYGGYDIDYRIEIVLDGLKVSHLPRARRFGTLSGGEKARVGLALLLLQSPDVLILDEPTNHLDFASMNWLENYQQSYRGAILVVSHDRHFLNRIASAIVEIDEHSHSAKRYSGDYDSYHRAKVQERQKWVSDYAQQQEEVKELRIAIKQTAQRNSNYRAHTDNDKFVINTKKETHAATVAKRIKVAEEKLKRIEADPIPQPPDRLRFEADFEPEALKGRMPLYAAHLSKRYGDNVVLDDVSFTLGAHSRVVFVGPNGAGKSTLLRILVGEERPDGGELFVNPGVRIGYLDQEGRTLDPALTVFEAYAQGLEGSEQALKSILLRSGLFRYDEFGKRVRALSAGQQRKLQIARLIAGRANLLMLDEPTNFVSLDVLEELETALKLFPGPVIAASHDRRFIEQFGGEVWALQAGRLSVDGYAQYVESALQHG